MRTDLCRGVLWEEKVYSMCEENDAALSDVSPSLLNMVKALMSVRVSMCERCVCPNLFICCTGGQ